MIFRSIRKVISNNIKVLKQLHTYDASRIFMTSLYWICDMVEIVIYNILLLPFLYYAIDHSIELRVFLMIEGILTVVLILCDVYQSYYHTTYSDRSNQRITHRFYHQMFAHIRNDDLENLYKPSGLDTILRLLNMGTYYLTSALDMQWWAVSVIVLGAVYVSVLINIDAFLILVAVLSSVFMFFVNLKLNKLNYQNMVENSAISRKSEYLVNRFTSKEYSQDLRTSSLKDVLIKSLHQVTLATYRRLQTVAKKVCRYTYLKNIVSFLISTSITWTYLGIKYLLLDSFTLGVTDIIVAQTMMQQLCNLLIDLSSIGPGLQDNSVHIEDFFQYMESEPSIPANENGAVPEKVANGICLRNVRFSYDGEKDVLKDISMDIRPGEKIAIVGKNGVGKSTLVKLLLQLYRPQSGEIEMDGLSAESYALNAYRERFGVAFQNTKLYAVSVAENVLMKPYSETAAEKVQVTDALKNGRLLERVQAEEKGIDAVVTKEFDADGIEFSGGQAQKLALSRVFARECGVVILDEPSAALDPISEAEMYESILELMNEKTVLLISHRLSACRKVDRIFVIDDGRIAEQGTHAELVQAGGIYAEMWQLQAAGYTEA